MVLTWRGAQRSETVRDNGLGMVGAATRTHVVPASAL